MPLTSCIKNNIETHYLRRMHYLMGTFLSIEITHYDSDEAKDTVESAFSEVRRIEALLSRFRNESQVYKINSYSHVSPQVVDEELFCLIQSCIDFSKSSGGSFDITVAPLMDVWSKAEKLNSLPEDTDIKYLLSNIGYKNVVLDKKTNSIYFKNAILKIDLGAVGKGYALEKAIGVLRKGGIRKATLDFGGHIHHFDDTGNTREYIGIKNPLFTDEIITSIPVKDKSISTSGNYERNFNIRGKGYGHIVNPASGYPADNGILSVSVICESTMLSDMLSTTVFVMGLEKGMWFIEDMDNAEALIVSGKHRKLNLHFSKGLKGGDLN